MQNQIHWAEIELLAAPFPPASLGRIFSLPLPASGGCSIPWLAAPGLPSLPHGPTTSSSLVCVQFPSASLISTLMMAFKDTPPPHRTQNPDLKILSSINICKDTFSELQVPGIWVEISFLRGEGGRVFFSLSHRPRLQYKNLNIMS